MISEEEIGREIIFLFLKKAKLETNNKKGNFSKKNSILEKIPSCCEIHSKSKLFNNKVDLMWNTSFLDINAKAKHELCRLEKHMLSNHEENEHITYSLHTYFSKSLAKCFRAIIAI